MPGLPFATPHPTRWELHAVEHHLPITLRDVPDHRQAIRGFLQGRIVSKSLIQDLEVVIDEALTNIAQHSYAGQADPTVHLQVCLEGLGEDRMTVLSLTLVDRGAAGQGFDPERRLARTKECLAAGLPTGFGIFLLYRLMDRVEYIVSPDGENRLLLQKWFCNGPAGPDYMHRLTEVLCVQGVLPPSEIDVLSALLEADETLDPGDLIVSHGPKWGADPTGLRNAVWQARLSLLPPGARCQRYLPLAGHDAAQWTLGLSQDSEGEEIRWPFWQ